MRILLPMLLALALTGCGLSRKQTKPLTLPQPPAQALSECTIPPLSGGRSEDVENDLKERGNVIAQCEAKRRKLIEAWPR